MCIVCCTYFTSLYRLAPYTIILAFLHEEKFSILGLTVHLICHFTCFIIIPYVMPFLPLSFHRKFAILKLTVQKVCHLDRFFCIFLMYSLGMYPAVHYLKKTASNICHQTICHFTVHQTICHFTVHQTICHFTVHQTICHFTVHQTICHFTVHQTICHFTVHQTICHFTVHQTYCALHIFRDPCSIPCGSKAACSLHNNLQNADICHFSAG